MNKINYLYDPLIHKIAVFSYCNKVGIEPQIYYVLLVAYLIQNKIGFTQPKKVYNYFEYKYQYQTLRDRFSWLVTHEYIKTNKEYYKRGPKYYLTQPGIDLLTGYYPHYIETYKSKLAKLSAL